MTLRILILPIGRVEEGALEHLRRSLTDAFPGSEADILDEPMEVPEDTYNPRRRQHNSSRILDHVASRHSVGGGGRVLGVTAADLYAPGLNFVFGEARPSSNVAVISIHRLRPEFYGEPHDEDVYLERAAKEAVHEVGHTLGLGHCPDPDCVMRFSNSILDTDRKRSTFCARCRRKIIAWMEH